MLDILPVVCLRHAHERRVAARSAGSSRTRPPSARGGDRRGVPVRPAVLPSPGQGPGQVRDAAGGPRRWHDGECGGGRPRLLPSRVLPGGPSVRRARHGRAGGRTSGPAGADQALGGDRRIPPPGAPRPLGRNAGPGGEGAFRGPAAPAPRRAGTPAVRAFWPPAEGAQADYETLRSAVLAGTIPVSPAGARFSRHGLVGLIRRPTAE